MSRAYPDQIELLNMFAPCGYISYPFDPFQHEDLFTGLGIPASYMDPNISEDTRNTGLDSVGTPTQLGIVHDRFTANLRLLLDVLQSVVEGPEVCEATSQFWTTLFTETAVGGKLNTLYHGHHEVLYPWDYSDVGKKVVYPTSKPSRYNTVARRDIFTDSEKESPESSMEAGEIDDSPPPLVCRIFSRIIGNYMLTQFFARSPRPPPISRIAQSSLKIRRIMSVSTVLMDTRALIVGRSRTFAQTIDQALPILMPSTPKLLPHLRISNILLATIPSFPRPF